SDFLKDDVGSGGLPFKGLLGGDDVVLDDIIAQDNADFFALNKGFGEAERVGDAAFAFLVGVMDAVAVEILAGGEEPEEVAGILAAGDDDDVLDAGVDERLDRIKNHGPIVNRKKMLIGDTSQRIETRPFSASQNDTLHDSSIRGLLSTH